MWTCIKCGRIFEKEKQPHSCRKIPLSEHFENKEKAKKLFEYLLEHINQKVAPRSWDSVAEAMAKQFAAKEFREGLLNAVRSVGDHLSTHFPAKPDDKNELSNKVDIS